MSDSLIYTCDDKSIIDSDEFKFSVIIVLIGWLFIANSPFLDPIAVWPRYIVFDAANTSSTYKDLHGRVLLPKSCPQISVGTKL